jgi:hypothetical protein
MRDEKESVDPLLQSASDRCRDERQVYVCSVVAQGRLPHSSVSFKVGIVASLAEVLLAT